MQLLWPEVGLNMGFKHKGSTDFKEYDFFVQRLCFVMVYVDKKFGE